MSRQDVRSMEEGPYWFYPPRQQDFRFRTTEGRMRTASFCGYPPDDSPIAVWVHRRAKGGFLYAAPIEGDWPQEGYGDGGSHVIRVCDLPGAWVRIPDPPRKEDLYEHAHFRTPCSAVETKG